MSKKQKQNLKLKQNTKKKPQSKLLLFPPPPSPGQPNNFLKIQMNRWIDKETNKQRENLEEAIWRRGVEKKEGKSEAALKPTVGLWKS